MAVDLHVPTTCNVEMEPSHEDKYATMEETEPPPTAVCGGDGAPVVYKKGAWSKEEDEKLKRAVEEYGLRNWVTVEKNSGLARPAKNCRLRWLNYLRPNLKKYPFTEEEEKLILRLHAKYGNSWSRIASKLPGRSDNEIKNFWHKRAKKCQKQNLPLYPTTYEKQQAHTYAITADEENGDDGDDDEAIADDEYFSNYVKDEDIPTNQPGLSLHSTQIHSQKSQPSIQNAPNTPYHTTDASTIPSPQTLLSTQFLPSPSSLVTSQRQSTTTDQITLLSNTPTSQAQISQAQNLILSSHHHMSQSAETPPLNPKNSPHTHQSSSWGGGGVFTPARKPPILSSPRGRFSRAKPQLSPTMDRPISGLQWPSAMESPRSTLNLKSSPGIPAQYSTQTSTQMTDLPFAPSSPLLKSPTTAPFSPLKLHWSLPVPPESCFQSDSTIPFPSQELKPSSCSLDQPSVQPMTVEAGRSPSVQFLEMEYDSNLGIMDELREAQAKVSFLKKKLRQKRITNKRNLVKQNVRKNHSTSGSPETTGLDGNSDQSSTNEYLICANSEKNNFPDEILRVKAPSRKDMLKRGLRINDVIGTSKREALGAKSARQENRSSELQTENIESGENTQGSLEPEKVTTQDENSEAKTLFEERLQGEKDSLHEILKSSMAYQEQRHPTESFDHLNGQNTVNHPISDSWDNKLCPFQGLAGKCLNECPTVEDLLSVTSNLLLDSFLKGDLFGQSSNIEGDHLCYIQHDEGAEFGYSFQQQFSDGCLYRKVAENRMIDSVMGVKSPLCEPNSLLNHYHAANQLDSSNLVSKPITEHESQFSLQTSGEGGNLAETQLRELLLQQHPSDNLINSGFSGNSENECLISEQYSLQTSVNGFYGCVIMTDSTPRETWKQEQPSHEQCLIEDLLVENLRPEGQLDSQVQTFSTNRFDKDVNPMESQSWYGESGCSHTGEVIMQDQGQDHMQAMSEDLSSLLEFFPTTNQTLEWYDIGHAIPETEASNEFNMGLDIHMPSTSQPQITIADYS